MFKENLNEGVFIMIDSSLMKRENTPNKMSHNTHFHELENHNVNLTKDRVNLKQ